MTNLAICRMDDIAAIESLAEGTSKKANPERVRRMALKYINDFVLAFSDTHSLAAALVSSAPAALAQVAEAARIPEAGHLRCRFSFIYGSLLLVYTHWSICIKSTALCNFLNLLVLLGSFFISILSLLGSSRH